MEDQVYSFLVDWTISYIKNKDIVQKKIESIERDREGFDLHVKYKDKDHYFLVAPTIIDIVPIVQKINTDLHVSVVALNSLGNFHVILKNWSRLVTFKFLSMIFVNPFSELDKKWVIFPQVHHKICDESSLESGLKSMFEMVEETDEQQMLAKIKG